MSLEDFGWSDFYRQGFEAYAREGLLPARVISIQGPNACLHNGEGEIQAVVAGRLRHGADRAEGLPAVGDWVAFRPGAEGSDSLIQALLPRRTKLSRKVAGRRVAEQVVAANLDVVLVVMGLDGDYNPRRLERFLAMVWESGALPWVVLNKADLCSAAEVRRAEVEVLSPGVDVYLLSSRTGQGVETLVDALVPGKTLALIGSSGAGKSTLGNRMAGRELLATSEVRSGDDRGQHTTTHRQLFRLPGGALLIDNPGIREVQPWLATEGLEEAFREIHDLAAGCRFRDCSHRDEPGCAVDRAVAEGKLSRARLDNFLNLDKEMRYLALKEDGAAMRREKKKIAAIHKAAKRFKPRL